MSDTIRVGFIGAGANTRLHHIPKLQAIEGVEAVAVCNRSMASGQAVSDAFGIAKVTTDPGGRVADPDWVAGAVLCRAGEDSSLSTASQFLVDGGISGAYVTPL